eukprot:scaffold1954_cov268-Pinguiococcus_pyrenoidosus.AAC.205
MVEATFQLEHLNLGVKDASYKDGFLPDCRSGKSGNLCVVFSASADQSLLLCLSGAPRKTKDCYELCIGAYGNTEVWLKRGRLQVARVPARLCKGDEHVTYWLTMSNGKICFGVGWEMVRRGNLHLFLALAGDVLL